MNRKNMVQYNLQFFAKDGPGGEKTEPATAKKLSDARKDGQVAKSKEITNAVGLISLFLILQNWVGKIGTQLMESFQTVYNKVPELVTFIDGELPNAGMLSIFRGTIWEMFLIVSPIFLIGFLVAFLGDYIQVKWKPTSKPLKPKFSKMNPLKGFKKILSAKSIVELLKSILIIILMVYVTYTTLIKRGGDIFLLYDISLNQAIALVGELAIGLGLKISYVYLIVAFIDFAYQKWKFKDDMKMTKQEVKDEYKDAEGDPLIKGKIRQKMREASQRRMMQALPEADVVITNPTHYAVAIKYDAKLGEAPIVVAKGEDYLAQKIKETAKKHHIEIVENKPLARMLYANVEIGGLVPPELYQAVAEVLAMVYKMQGKI